MAQKFNSKADKLDQQTGLKGSQAGLITVSLLLLSTVIAMLQSDDESAKKTGGMGLTALLAMLFSGKDPIKQKGGTP